MYSEIFGKRVSLLIRDKKGKYLLVKSKSDGDSKIAFPSISFTESQLPDNTRTDEWIKDELQKCIGIQAIDIKRIENFYHTDFSFNHYIYKVNRYTGNVVKGTYDGFMYQRIDELDYQHFDIYGMQVIQKIKECTYCQKICEKKSEIEAFLHDYMQHNVGASIIKLLDSNDDKSEELYRLCINSYFSHLRALLVETPTLKKNRTLQNLLSLYEREDLVNEVVELLGIKIFDSLTLKDVIKIYVDKNVAHYDVPDDTAQHVYEYINGIFTNNGLIPLEDFISYIEAYIVSIVVEVFYYAGELGEMISHTSDELGCYMDCNRQAILESLEKVFDKHKEQ